MRKSLFTIDGIWAMFEGYTDGKKCNGMARPYFTKEVADKIAETYNAEEDYCEMRYNAEKDCFETLTYNTEHDEEFKGVDIDGMHLYPVGNTWWNDLADYQNKQEKMLMEYLLKQYSWLNHTQLYDVYYGICQEINGYVSDEATKHFADGYMYAYGIYVLQKENQTK